MLGKGPRKPVISLRYTRVQDIFRSTKRLFIELWKVEGALHNPCGIQVVSKSSFLEISAYFLLLAGEIYLPDSLVRSIVEKYWDLPSTRYKSSIWG